MRANFLSLPGEIRNTIYNHVLVSEEPLAPGGINSSIAPKILLANKTIYNEAASLLYSENTIDLAEYAPREISSFLCRIGPGNARNIHCIRLDLSCFIYNAEYFWTAGENDSDLRALALIRTSCPELKTLVLSQHLYWQLELELEASASNEHIEGVLRSLDARLRAFTSLETIVAEVVYGAPGYSVLVAQMEGYGWKASSEGHSPAKDNTGERGSD
ncbi:hypothetical protein BJY04DRAFT_176722 [Aspergillus karnatakaensis]|uniref:uncharacterized protein n=1 Tax=Aspergillus karnatakaensis TaxID=1810916 RepID=UPI003CCDFC60